ncbi:MAG: DUF1150 family protein [Stellaceae bacterium]
MSAIEHIRQMSREELALFGVQDMAYVKPVLVEGVRGYAVHAADGTEMTVLADRDTAFAMLRQHDLEPMSVH